MEKVDVASKKKQKQKKTSIVLGSIKLIYSKKRFDIQLM